MRRGRATRKGRRSYQISGKSRGRDSVREIGPAATPLTQVVGKVQVHDDDRVARAEVRLGGEGLGYLLSPSPTHPPYPGGEMQRYVTTNSFQRFVMIAGRASLRHSSMMPFGVLVKREELRGHPKVDLFKSTVQF